MICKKRFLVFDCEGQDLFTGFMNTLEKFGEKLFFGGGKATL